MSGVDGVGEAPPSLAPPSRLALWRGLSAPVRLSILGQLAALPVLLVPGAWPWVVGWLLAHHVVLTVAGTVPRSRLLGTNQARTENRSVALTFDDGPDPDVTPRVLELLREDGHRATFFLIGERARRHPGLVRRILEEGHRIENHTEHHSSWFCTFSPRHLHREIHAAQRSLASAGAPPPTRFRAPAGVRSPWLEPVLRTHGLLLTSWSSRGFDTSQRHPGTVLRRLLRELRPGSILLLHDGNCARTEEGRPVVLEVLPHLLAELRARALRSEPLDSFDVPVGSNSP